MAKQRKFGSRPTHFLRQDDRKAIIESAWTNSPDPEPPKKVPNPDIFAYGKGYIKFQRGSGGMTRFWKILNHLDIEGAKAFAVTDDAFPVVPRGSTMQLAHEMAVFTSKLCLRGAGQFFDDKSGVLIARESLFYLLEERLRIRSSLSVDTRAELGRAIRESAKGRSGLLESQIERQIRLSKYCEDASLIERLGEILSL